MADYDVIVVGAGNAALAASVSAKTEGANRVLVLEKATRAERGGNTHFSGGLFRFAFSDPEQLRPIVPDAEEEFPLMGENRLCFFGHTHVRVLYSLSGEEEAEVSREEHVRLREGTRYLVNPGSVGQPRDRDPRAAFLIFDDRGDIEFRRVVYPIEAAQRKIIENGLDRFLAERLSLGY